MKEGWIKIHRKLLEWEWADTPEMMSVWVHLLIDASFCESTWHGIEVKRGQVVIGRDRFAKECGISEQILRTCLTRLEKNNQIIKKSTNKYTIITICRYDDYQNMEECEQPANNQQITNEQPANNQQITTLKECKENNNISSSARMREFIKTINLYWNQKINIPEKQIAQIDDSNPERLARTTKILETYGLERVKLAIDIIAKNKYLLRVANFDRAITDAVTLEKILSGYYTQRESEPIKIRSHGTDRLQVTKHTGNGGWQD